MSILTKEGIQKIFNDDWLLMDDCEGLENCTVIKELARIALAAMDSEPVAVTDDELNAALQLHRLKVDGHSQLSDAFRAGFRYARRTTPQPAPVVQCPFPCGWDNLNKLAIQDAAFVARGLIEGEPATEAHRQAAISNNDRLLKVISACRAAILNGGKS